MGTATNLPTSSTAENQPATTPRTHYDPWEINEKLRHAERVLQLGRRPGPGLDETLRFDPSMYSAPIWNASAPPSQQRHPIATGAAWLLIAGGTSGLSCGILLAIWSWLGQRSDLWNLGLPIMVVGQMLLLAGVLVHFGRGGKANSRTSEALQPPQVFNHFSAPQQYRVDPSEIYGGRPGYGRNAPPPRA